MKMKVSIGLSLLILQLIYIGSLSAFKCDIRPNGVCYKILRNKGDFSEAENNCFIEGGRLAIMTNADEMESVVGYMKKNGIDRVYIGLSDSKQRGTFRWVDGKVLKDEGFIQNDSWKPRKTVSCIVLASNGKWFQMKCSQKVKALCQKTDDMILKSPKRVWSGWKSIRRRRSSNQFLTINSLRKAFPDLCPQPLEAQCRVKGKKTPSDKSGDVLARACSKLGMVCKNSDQKKGKCARYEVRFLCPEDVNECKDPKLSKCDKNAKCINSFGSYKCVCKRNYAGDGRTCHRAAKCTAWGDPHYTTFDGLVRHFQGICTYRFMETCIGAGATDKQKSLPKFGVTQSNEHRKNNKVSFAKAVTFYFAGSKFQMKKDKILFIDGIKLSPPQTREFNETKIEITLGTSGLQISTSFGLRLQYDGVSRLTAYVPFDYQGQMCGMCGNLDGNKLNDRRTSDGSITDDYSIWGNSWTAKEQDDPALCNKTTELTPNTLCDSKTDKIVTEKCSVLTSTTGPFAECHGLVDPQTVYPSCYFDVCSDPGNFGLLCNAYGEYAKKCAAEGVLLDWRSDTGCEVKCGANEHFEAQTSGCQGSCDDPSAADTCSLPDTFGCVCDEGFLRNGEQCKPQDQCGCYDKYKNYRKIGDVWFTDKCTIKHKCVGTNDIISDPHVSCHTHGKCVKLMGKKNEFDCRCKKGFEGNADNCTDIDECTLGKHACSDDGICVNELGKYSCKCRDGFTGNGFSCKDINECKKGLSNCSSYATCHNTRGSYKCICNRGYEGDGVTCSEKVIKAEKEEHKGCSFHKEATCHEIAECHDKSDGSFVCSCPEGALGDGRKGKNSTGCKYAKCPKDSYGFYGYCYKFLPKENTQEKNEKLCQKLGGYSHLATFSDPMSHAFIVERMELFGKTKPLYIGYFGERYEKKYVSMDFSANNFKNWATNEPDLSKKCVVILPPKTKESFKFKTVDCNEKYQAICKFPASPRKCPDGWREISKTNPRCVTFIKKPITPFEALIECSKYGGDLASILTIQEAQQLQMRLLRLGQDKGNVVIGLQRNLVGRSSRIKWSNGVDKVKYQNWKNKKEQLVTDGDIECFVVVPGGKWKPVDCSKKQSGYLCERPQNLFERCPKSSEYFNGKCYRHSKPKFTFPTSESSCVKTGGELVSIETIGEQQFIEDYLVTKGLRKNQYWIGLKEDETIPNTYTWTDDTNYEFKNWGKNEPGRNESDNCGAIKEKGNSQQFPWFEDICGVKRHALCEYLNTPCSKDNECHKNGECHMGQCRCKLGTTGNGITQCKNLNECKASKKSSPCKENEECVDTMGSFLCNCAKDYIRSDKGVCQHKLFCLGNADCAKNGKCFEQRCSCNLGYQGDGKLRCDDIDECKDPKLNKCDPNADCTNKPGEYSCKCKSGYHGDGIKECHKIARTCHEYLTKHPGSPSGIYTIDPDQEGPIEPFDAVCKMRPGIGITVILHDRITPNRIKNPKPLTEDVPVNYELPLNELQPIIDASGYCYQDMTFECKGSFDLMATTMYYDGKGRPHKKWGASETENKCGCGELKLCKKPTAPCFCDGTNVLKAIDSGRLINKDMLPITKIMTGGNSKRGQGFITISPLYCGPKPFDMPTNCDDAKNSFGQDKSDATWIDVDGDGPLKHFKVFCDVTSRPFGITKVPHDKIPGNHPSTLPDNLPGPLRDPEDPNSPEGVCVKYVPSNPAIAKLMSDSGACTQEVKYDCEAGSKLLQNKAYLTTTTNKKLNYFGSSTKPNKCACGAINQCDRKESACNCDGTKPGSDFGFIRKKEDLPIKCLVDQNGNPSPANSTIGPLMCAPGKFGIEPSCHEWLKRGYNESNTYLVDPDGGNQNEDPKNIDEFLVKCEMVPFPPKGVTKIPVEKKPESCSPKSTLCKNPVSYPLTPKEIKPIIARSAYCRQRITYKCRHMTLLKPYKDSDPSPYAFWRKYGQENKNSKKYHFFAGDGVKNDTICQCGLNEKCDSCNCDISNAKLKVDEGYITDKNVLPIGAVWIGQDRDVAGLVSTVEVGDLECFENFPTCKAYLKGFRRTTEKRKLYNGFHSLDPDGPGGEDPIVVKCQNGKTIVPAEMEPIDITDKNDTLIGPKKKCFEIKYKYTKDPTQLKELAKTSKYCRQYMRISCQATPLTGYVSWYNRDGVEMKGWAGNSGGDKCACGEVRSCEDKDLACNCDSMSKTLIMDHGLLVDKSILPVSKVCLGITEKIPKAKIPRRLRVEIDPLICTENLEELEPDCQRLRENQYQSQYRKRSRGSEAWIIDPDQEGPIEPFTTFCDMKTNLPVGITEIRNKMERDNKEVTCKDVLISSDKDLSVEIKYLASSEEQIRNLTSVSSHCEQQVTIDCENTPIFDGVKYGAYSFDGILLKYWLGPEDANSCTKDTCRCNKETKPTSDNGKFTDKSVLPLSKIVLPPSTKGRVKLCVYPLKCYNLPKNCDAYNKEARLSSKKGNRNNIWAIDSDGQGGEDYFGVLCKKEGNTIVTQSLQKPDPKSFDSKKTDEPQDVTYDDTNTIQLKNLVDNSKFCSQRLDYFCRNTGTLGANTPRLFDRQNRPMSVWSGADFYGNETSGCACDILGNCPNNQNCRCNQLSKTMQYEGGVFTNKEYLPLRRMKFEKNQDIKSAVHALKCANDLFDIPADCEKAYLQAYRMNTEVLIRPRFSPAPFLALCDMETEKKRGLKITVIPTKTVNKTIQKNNVVIDYSSTDFTNVRNLVKQSKYCMQPIKLNCESVQTSPNLSWYSTAINKYSSNCHCASKLDCARNIGDSMANIRGRKCNCDALSSGAPSNGLKDVIFITNKIKLPILSVNVLGNVSDADLVTVGPLMCSNKKFVYNECKEGFHDCDVNAVCKDKTDGFTCTCKSGWQGKGGNERFSNGRRCIDDNECKMGKCPSVSDCVNKPGSFQCNCHKGFKKIAKTKCVDINECYTIPNVCDTNARCINTYGSYICRCKPGFRGSGKPGECEAVASCGCWGDPHCLSFDGKWAHYQGKCKYTLVRDGCKNGVPNTPSTFEVIMKNWDQNRKTKKNVRWAKEITIKTKDLIIMLKLGPIVTVNGQKTTLPFEPKNKNGTKLGINVSYYGRNVRLTTDTGLEVKWDGKNRVEATIGSKFQSKVCGICGNFNRKKSDDWIIGPKCDVSGQKTSILNLFGDSWRNDDPSPTGDASADYCPTKECRTVPTEKPCDAETLATGRRECEKMRQKFKECEKEMVSNGRNMDELVESCVYDYCHSSQDLTEMICKTAENIAEMCTDEYKVNIKFRDDNFCKVTCGKKMVYKECASPCQPTCTTYNKTNTDKMCAGMCKEACVCESGLVMEAGKCIKPEECGCTMKDGTYYKHGEKRTNKNCTETCTCNRATGQLECREISCSMDGICGFKDDDYGCFCKSGYMGNGYECKDIDECSKTPSVCDKNADCTNTIGSYKCKCRKGYEGDGKSCTNINECVTMDKPCDNTTEDCFDKVPGYDCRCKEGFKRNMKTGKCEDKNECKDTGNLCDRVSTVCNNTFGSYRCECKQGYRPIPNNNFICEDVNECKQVHECDKKFAKCTNTPGSYYCTCYFGYEGERGRNCTDIDECKKGDVCQYPGSKCVNLDGGYECRCANGSKGCDGPNPCDDIKCTKPNERCYLGSCVCERGFERNTTTKICEDINECDRSENNCAEKKAYCVNLDGSFKCKCLYGYRMNPITKVCENVDECKEGSAKCSNNAECVDTDGGYYCQCQMGFTGHCDECRDIDECAVNLHKCHKYLATCKNTIGSHICECKPGFKGDGKVCLEINECKLGIDNCNEKPLQTCVNSLGSYKCICETGYVMDKTSGECVDLNECALADNGCDENAVCINKVGSYKCECKDGFRGNGRSCKPKEGREMCNGKLCPLNSKCEDGNCKCSNGFKQNGNKCEDIDECALNQNLCDSKATCLNTQGSYLCYCPPGFIERDNICVEIGKDSDIDKCLLEDFCIDGECISPGTCKCPDGWELNPANRCIDNRCTNVKCPPEAICSVTSGTPECVCPAGTQLSADKKECNDIDECEDNIDDCQQNSICKNLYGSFECTCESSYNDVFGDGKICIFTEDKNCNKKCATGQYCKDGECVCMPGLAELKTDNFTVCAKEKPDCKPGTCPENSVCRDRLFGFECDCPTGYVAVGTESCTDINECDFGLHTCSKNEKCFNTPGSFECNCPKGSEKKNGTCEKIKKCDCGSKGVCGKDGKCICSDGYVENKEGTCEDIDECKKDNSCHVLAKCINTPGSYKCKCADNFYGNPYTRCIEDKCATGKICMVGDKCTNGLYGSVCVKKVCQADEYLFDGICSTGQEICNDKKCSRNAFCKIDNNRADCFCDSGYQGDGESCEDIDECSTGKFDCPANSRCVNRPGTYYCDCDNGYERKGSLDPSIPCTDIDECAIKGSCAENAECTNKVGSYECQCKDGFLGDGKYNCEPDSKCEKFGGCHTNATCIQNLAKDNQFECKCNSGYSGDGISSCIKNNACFKDNGESKCHANANCEVKDSTFNCVCPKGYQGDGIQFCEDENECLDPSKHTCTNLQNCINTVGGFRCVCGAGAKLVDGKCEDINECEGSGKSVCSEFSVCTNTEGSFSCKCKDGYYGDGVNCADIDECRQGIANCDKNALCRNKPGSFDCECQAGTVGNGTDCDDEDECLNKEKGLMNAAQCDENAVCINKDPGYDCKCKEGYVGTGYFCAKENPCNKPNVCSMNEACVPSENNNAAVCICKEFFEKKTEDSNCTAMSICKLKKDNCNKISEICVDLDGGFKCDCKPGFKKVGDVCLDKTECDPTSPDFQAGKCLASGGRCLNTPGSFACTCPPSDKVDNEEKKCLPINPCDFNTHNCNRTTEKCVKGTGAEYTCQCVSGYEKKDGVCIDTDECELKVDNCRKNSVCVNTIGSFKCVCKDNKKLNIERNACIDRDECLENPLICGPFATCTNIEDSYECNCITGYTKNGTDCVDIDECATNTHLCHDYAECSNIPGSCKCKCKPGYRGDGLYVCEEVDNCPSDTDVKCPVGSHCKKIGTAKYSCECSSGYNKIGQNCKGAICYDTCVDINECITKKNACQDKAKCVNTDGSYLCDCPDYLEGDGKIACQDIDECGKGIDRCNKNTSFCVNKDNSLDPKNKYECKCSDGFIKIPGTDQCTDKNECLDPKENDCGKNSLCKNTEGSFECVCEVGLKKLPGNQCEDIDECAEKTHECKKNSKCENTKGSYLCKCDEGYKSDSSGRECEDLNECDNPLACQAIPNSICINNPGSFQCVCPDGLSLQGQRCQDIDECSTSKNLCGKNATCKNTVGSFICVCEDLMRQTPNGDCEPVNECMEGTDDCVKLNGAKSSCLDLPKGYACTCPAGFKNDEKNHYKCIDLNECAGGMHSCPARSSKCINTYGGYRCQCLPGFQASKSGDCKDIDECSVIGKNSKNNICGNGGKCINNEGGYKCECEKGYQLKNGICEDIDECTIDRASAFSDNCGSTKGLCVNKPGTYICKCPTGYQHNSTINECQDIDECLYPGTCQKGGICNNLAGSYRCLCKNGYRLNGVQCKDIDECEETPNKCGSEKAGYCGNREGGHECRCNNGYSNSDPSNLSSPCQQINECVYKNVTCPANSYCTNKPTGGYECVCKPGYKLDNIGICRNIDECTESNVCHYLANCIDNDGSYECKCKKGYKGDGRTNCERICKSDSCPTNKICRVIDESGNFECGCKCQGEQCAESGPVCDSDGKTQQSQKALVEYNCKQGDRKATVEYFHECKKSCDDVTCPPSESCSMKKGRPTCDCPPCTDEENQPETICATNGIQFQSLCQMKMWVCFTKLSIKRSYKGACQKPINCKLSEWSSWTSCSRKCGVGKEVRTRQVTRKKKFNGKCDKLLKETQQCYNGPCPGDLCEKTVCPPGAMCDQGKCICPNCYNGKLGNDDFICGKLGGSDKPAAKTFGSLCLLRAEACAKNVTFQFVHRGKCGDHVPSEPAICSMVTKYEIVRTSDKCSSREPVRVNQCGGGCGKNPHYCCRVQKTRQLRVLFDCPDKSSVYKEVQSIESCNCKLEGKVEEIP